MAKNARTSLASVVYGCYRTWVLAELIGLTTWLRQPSAGSSARREPDYRAWVLHAKRKRFQPRSPVPQLPGQPAILIDQILIFSAGFW